MYRYDADELDTMASGIVEAIRKYSIPFEQLTDEEIWNELQKKGYNFPFRGKRYFNFLEETAWWFEALHLAIQRLRA
jgi:hypothetical protein